MGAAPSQADITPSPPFQISPLPVPAAPHLATAPSSLHPASSPAVPAVQENRIAKEHRTVVQEEQHQGQMQRKKKIPHKFNAIVKEADNYLYPNGSLDDHVYSGIFLNKKTKKYWVDEETGHNCFTLFPRYLAITWGEDPRYWQWLCLKETNDVEIEVASLVNVCWLEIHGKLETSYLSPGVPYEVAFIVMMSEQAFGWSTPVTLRIKLQDGRIEERKECFHHKPKGKWIEIKVGEVMTKPNQTGEMEVSMFEYEGGQWKAGILIRSVIIRPKKLLQPKKYT